MHECKLSIKIFTQDDNLLEVLRPVILQDKLKKQCCFLTVLDKSSLSDGDLIIWDLPIDNQVIESWRHCKKNVEIVLCSAKKPIDGTDKASYKLISDFWFKPFCSEIVVLRFRKIVDNIKKQKFALRQQIYFDTLIDSAPSLIWFKDLRGSHIKVNNAFCHAVGKAKAQIEGRGHYYIWDIPQEDYEQGEYVCLETEEMVIDKRELCIFDEKVKSKQGMRQFKTYKAPLFDEAGVLVGTLGIAYDRTDLENMDAEMDVLLRSLPFAVLFKNVDNEIIKVNDKVEKYFATRKDKVIGCLYDEWKSSIGLELMEGFADRHLEGIFRRNGNDIYIKMYETDIRDIFANYMGSICIFHDITAEKKLQFQLFKSANTDELTGLYNRRYLHEFFQDYVKKTQLSLFYIDIDNFKQVNDTYGHYEGDLVLKHIADLLREVAPNDIVARIGGDEFLIAVINKIEKTALQEKARVILNRMRQAFMLNSRYDFLSISIGISQFDYFSQMDIEELLNYSDLALYQVKKNGKNGYYIYDAK